jgi:2-polyprenyl-3-methyl-5-hydroxy-6-metoxy-1,4-benzoquinol methylase
MFNQIQYYNQFGKLYEKSILECPEPEFWTTDYAEKGRIYEEMKKRVEQQKELILDYLKKDFPVLDIGCGFGRQAVLLAKNGFTVTGTDTSDVFISIAGKLFAKHNYKGNFLCTDILNSPSGIKFSQILLLDVLEHIKPSQRKSFCNRLGEITDSREGGILILSLPHIKKRLSSKINNRIRRRITQYFTYFFAKEEHPYPVPEKKEILRLTARSFCLLKFIESADTDYYVFRRN